MRRSHGFGLVIFILFFAAFSTGHCSLLATESSRDCESFFDPAEEFLAFLERQRIEGSTSAIETNALLNLMDRAIEGRDPSLALPQSSTGLRETLLIKTTLHLLTKMSRRDLLRIQEVLRQVRQNELESQQFRQETETITRVSFGPIQMERIELGSTHAFYLCHKNSEINKLDVFRVRWTKPFFISRQYITREQWNYVMGSDHPVKLDNEVSDLPVTGISRNQADLFIARLNESISIPNGPLSGLTHPANLGKGRFALPSLAQRALAIHGWNYTEKYPDELFYLEHVLDGLMRTPFIPPGVLVDRVVKSADPSRSLQVRYHQMDGSFVRWEPKDSVESVSTFRVVFELDERSDLKLHSRLLNWVRRLVRRWSP